MPSSLARVILMAGLASATAGLAAPGPCLVIAHRGASGYLPEHTLPAYRLGALLGADYLEPDLVMSRDGVLVARHEAGLAGTTDVASRPEFAGRRKRRIVAGQPRDDWYADDFTLAELRSLRARERWPERRPANTAFDGLFDIPTLDAILDLRAALSRELGREVGLYPELKSPEALRARGLDPEGALVRALSARGLATRTAPVIVQSFEPASLRRLGALAPVRRVQLLPLEPMAVAAGEAEGVGVTPLPDLTAVAAYADGIGIDRALLRDARGRPTDLVRRAHRAGLFVHAWTYRRETAGAVEPGATAPLPDRSAAIASIRRDLALGLDGLFTDQPDLGAAACGR